MCRKEQMISTIAPKHDYDNSSQTRDYTLGLGHDYDNNNSSQRADYTWAIGHDVGNSAMTFNMTMISGRWYIL